MRGQQISPRQIELIKQTYAETESLTAAAKAATVSIATARKYVRSADEFEKVRTEKRQELIAETATDYVPRMLAAIGRYLDHISQPEVIAATNARDGMIVIGTAIDKVLLLTGRATERTEQVNVEDARARLAAKLDEIVARRAALNGHGES
jgi:hypothetical protein